MQVQAQVFRNTQFSGHCWICDCAADVPLVCLCLPSIIVNYAYSGPENIETAPWMSERELTGRMNPDFKFITPSARRTVAPLLYSRPYTGWWWRSCALGEVLMGGSGTRSFGRTDQES
ncbi:hypothetical protein AVEN_46131-1 [Araneus ventricosus]|uniref:Uncharacterized protein n=1 Tax=Araneus ventricosus TaxID=182803 RepID=A0A4Y2D9G2_ARAVE|nr:hypothetical protein AVEN_46131-1 [Araneus ventricosus]